MAGPWGDEDHGNDSDPDFDEGDEEFPTEPIQVPITDELDLHNFRPKDIGSLLPDYIEECIKLKIYEVRIIHGKGSGALRKGVHAVLKRDERVVRFYIPDEARGGLGATVVVLKKD